MTAATARDIIRRVIKPAVGLLKSMMMARIVNKKDHELRRNEILDVAQRLVYAKGYEQMSIQNILSDLEISKGAFYHYFDSKQALMEALIKRLENQMEQLLLPIIRDPNLNAREKMGRFFDVAARWKTNQKDYLLTLMHAWYSDENILLRQKLLEALTPKAATLLAVVIRQGIQEGVFHTKFPEQVSEITFSLVAGFGDSMIKLIRQGELQAEAVQHLETTAGSYEDAVERILGADPGTLHLFDTTILREWFPTSRTQPRVAPLPNLNGVSPPVTAKSKS